MANLNSILDKLSKKHWLLAAILGAIVSAASFLSGIFLGRRQQAKRDERVISQSNKKVREYQAKLDSAGDNAKLAQKYRRLLDAALRNENELEGRS